MSAEIDPQFAPDDRPPENAPDALDYREGGDVSGMHAAISREKNEPVSNTERPLSIWLVALCGLILFWGGGYLMAFSGGFRGDNYNAIAFGGAAPTKSGGGSSAVAGGAAPAQEDPVKLGERYFAANCIACHQASGTGLPGQYPPLAGSEWVQGSPKRLAAILLHGVQGPINVEGATFNGQMPAWGTTLNDKRIACILTYIRQTWGNKGGPVTPDTVAAERKDTAAHEAPWSQPELKALPE